MQKLINKVNSIEELIKNKMLIVDADSFHVSMLGELWNSFSDANKVNLCQNLVNYCKLKNEKDNSGSQVLLVSIKDTKDNVAPYAYFRNGAIELIKDSHYLRQGNSSLKLLIRILMYVLIVIVLIIIGMKFLL